jgi:hypothetical protein
VLEHHPEQVRSAFEGLTGPEQAELRRLLDGLSAHLERVPGDGAADGHVSAHAGGR